MKMAQTKTPAKSARTKSAAARTQAAPAPVVETRPVTPSRNGSSSPLHSGSSAAAPTSPAFKKTMADLKKAGTAANCKSFPKHGVKGEYFGVSPAQLRTIARKVNVDHDLARQLWATANHDARMLATIVADPIALTASELDQWVRQVDNYLLADSFSALVARSPQAASRIDRWTRSKREFERRCGFGIVAEALKEGVTIYPALLDAAINQIEREIHSSANRAREGMNLALIAIGTYRDDLRDRALNTASRIGKIEIDQGESGCKNLDAMEAIERAARSRKPARKSRKSS